MTLQVQIHREEPPPPAPPPRHSVPAFYFPRGRPLPSALDVDDVIAQVERAFAAFPQERAGLGDMGAVAKVGGSWGYGRGKAGQPAMVEHACLLHLSVTRLLPAPPTGLRLPAVLESPSVLRRGRGAHRLRVSAQVRGHVEEVSVGWAGP